MKNKKLIFAGIALIAVLGLIAILTPLLTLLGLGSLFVITRAEGQQPTQVVMESGLTTTGYPPVVGCTTPVDLPVVDGRVSYNGISLAVDPSLSASLAAQTCAANTDQASMLAGDAHPAYSAFLFRGNNRQNTDFQPELRVYEVMGNMSAYTYPLNVLGDLKSVIDQRPQPVSWYNAAPLHTRQAYVDFENGAGVRGVVQYMQDRYFFTNNGLLDEFNGLTKDGRYFVSLRYPLSVPFLMELDGLDPRSNLNSQAIAIPDWPSNYEEQGRIIDAYNAEALRQLEQMQDSEASPDISLLDALVSSIEIGQP